MKKGDICAVPIIIFIIGLIISLYNSFTNNNLLVFFEIIFYNEFTILLMAFHLIPFLLYIFWEKIDKLYSSKIYLLITVFLPTLIWFYNFLNLLAISIIIACYYTTLIYSMHYLMAESLSYSHFTEFEVYMPLSDEFSKICKFYQIQTSKFISAIQEVFLGETLKEKIKKLNEIKENCKGDEIDAETRDEIFSHLDKIIKMEHKQFEKRINEYLSIKNIGLETYIYVGGKRFHQCMGLIIELDKKKDYSDIKSIDDIPVNLTSDDYYINPLEEFWGHCSNLQAWAELDYDTKVLHSSLSIPLLTELMKSGDKKAGIVLKEEIAKRYKKGTKDNRRYIIDNYFKYFTPEEIDVIVQNYEAEYREIQEEKEDINYSLEELEEEIYGKKKI